MKRDYGLNLKSHPHCVHGVGKYSTAHKLRSDNFPTGHWELTGQIEADIFPLLCMFFFFACIATAVSVLFLLLVKQTQFLPLFWASSGPDVCCCCCIPFQFLVARVSDAHQSCTSWPIILALITSQ